MVGLHCLLRIVVYNSVARFYVVAGNGGLCFVFVYGESFWALVGFL